ncbi:MAG TPA: PepSY domain-containing protein [Micromonospora sp.]|nr:PepSY domain-containing protein [Micromonospora sp.]
MTGALGLAGLSGGAALVNSKPHPATAHTDASTVVPASGSAGIGTAGRHDDDSGRPTTPAGHNGLITIAEAVDAAQARVPQGQVKEIELEREHGRLVWSIELMVDGVEYEVDVDAKTGDVVEVERDDDDDDRDDD